MTPTATPTSEISWADAWLDAWLDARFGHCNLSDDQRAALLLIAEAIDARYPAPEAAEHRTAAFAGAVAVVLGESTTEQVRLDWLVAQHEAMVAHARLTGAIIAEARRGASALALARRLGMARETIRKALGKI